MAEELDAELNLSTDAAESSVEALGTTTDDALNAAAVSFGDAMEAAISGVPELELDTSAIPEDLTGAIDAGIAGAETAVPVEAETEQLSLGIEEAIDGANAEIPALFDAAGFEAQIDDAIASADTTVEIDADTSGAQAAIEQVGEAASDSSGGVKELGSSASGLNAVSGLATGSVAGLASEVSGLDGVSASGVGALVGIATAVGLMFNEAVDATGAQQRFNSTLGDSADAVENLRNIEGLNTNLGELALTLGSDDDKVRQTAARLYQLATASGIAEDAASTFTQQTIAMGARALATNPTLGDLGDVTDGLSTAFVRGGRFATKYGLDLNQAEINERALLNTHKEHTDELTFVEKAMAGAQLASEKYGAGLEGVIARGSENAITQQRRLKQTIIENIEAAGMPLVMPIFEVMEEGIPIVEAFGRVIGTVAEAGIPILTVLLQAALPIVEAFAQGLADIGPGALQVIAILLTLGYAVKNFSTLMGTVTTALSANPWVLLAVGVVTAVGALDLFGGGADEASAATDRLTESLIENNGAFDENSTRVLRANLESQHQLDDLRRAGVGFDEYTAAIESAGGATEDQIDHLRRMGLAWALGEVPTRKFIAALREVSPELADVAGKLARNGELNQGLAGSLINSAGAQAEATRATRDRAAVGASDADISGEQADAADDEATARDKATEAVNAYKEALDGLLGRHLTLAEAELKSADAADGLAEAYGAVADESTTAEQIERGRIQAVIDATKAAQDLSVATYDSVNATDGAAAAAAAAQGVMTTFAANLRDQLINAFGLSEEAADALMAKIGLIPDTTRPSFEAFVASAEGQMLLAQQAVHDHGQAAADEAELAAQSASLRWKEGLATMPTSAADAMGAVGPALQGALGSATATAYASGLEVGSQVGTGINQGLGSWVGSIAETATHAVRDAVQAARAEAGIASPSTVFMEIGANMGEGMALGFEDSASAVVRAAEDVIRASANAFPQPGPTSAGVDADALGRAIGAALGDRAGVQVIVVGSPGEARSLLPSDVRNDPRILTFGRR